jgi:membrane-anchored mycosin MYCP
VSGIAALVRARSPHLTARQVMQRIKDTAHRPPAGWDPFVGHGVVDALAAVSGDTNTAPMTVETDAQQKGDQRPVSPPVTETQSDPIGRRIAFGGAGVCVAVVAAAVAMTASLGRLRRRADTVARD